MVGVFIAFGVVLALFVLFGMLPFAMTKWQLGEDTRIVVRSGIVIVILAALCFMAAGLIFDARRGLL